MDERLKDRAWESEELAVVGMVEKPVRVEDKASADADAEELL